MHTFYLESFFSLDEIKILNECKNKNIIISLYQDLANSLQDNKKVIDNLAQFKKLSYKEISILVHSLIIGNKIENKQKLLEISNNIKFNLSKVLLFNQIINLIK